MTKLLEWIEYTVPWWIWLVPGLPVVVFAILAVYRHLGFRNALVAGLALLIPLIAILSRQRGKQEGWDKRRQKEDRDVEVIISKADKARSDVRNADPGQLRDDDGFRRP